MYRKFCIGLLAATCLVSAQNVRAQAENENEPLAGYADNSPIVLTGTVVDVRDDEFTMSYGSGEITVETEEWMDEETEEGVALLSPGDQVTVSGRIDDSLFEGREIVASNIYLDNAYVYYYYDTNDYPAYFMTYNEDSELLDGTFVSMRGVVRSIEGREFVLASQDGKTVQVDTEELDYDPFDEEGLQQIRVGDRVHVYGDLDDSFFETREIKAEGIVTLTQRTGAPAGSVN